MIIIKTPEEIELIGEACRIVEKVLLDIEKEIRPGVTTEELDSFGESQILKYGGLPAFKGYRGFRNATCISVNYEVVHGIPSKKKLYEGDIVSVDVGAIYRGYHGDGARTFPVGKISRLAEKLLNACEEALVLGINAITPNGNIGDVSNAIEQYAKKHGFQVVRDLFGHGLGLSLHEDPLIPNFGQKGTGPKLQPNMVLAIEPMLNVGTHRIVTLDDGWTVVTEDRSLSAHFEDTIVVTDKGCRILTRTNEQRK